MHHPVVVVLIALAFTFIYPNIALAVARERHWPRSATNTVLVLGFTPVVVALVYLIVLGR